MTGKLDGRIALITGASRGIGYAVAKRFATEGAHVLALARTQGGLEDLDDEIKSIGGSATLIPLDLEDYDGIDRMGASIAERWGKLDILVGNAGALGNLSPLGHHKPKDFDKALAVNVTANYRLIRSLDPLLKQSDAGRAVFVTSGAADKCRSYWGLYSTTKAALNAMVKTYAAECEISNVKANLLSPGPTRTAMRAQAMPGEDPETLKAPDALCDLFVELASSSCNRNGETVSYSA